MTHELSVITQEMIQCRLCPRLVQWREQVAQEKRRAYQHDTYWGRAVPGFGDPDAKLVIVGLAPAAHGANRTGRMFTGDRSGDFLYAALHRAGFASQPTSTHLHDGLTLHDVFITAPCHCAPPQNMPTSIELAACQPWFERELMALSHARAYLALGKIGYDAMVALVRKRTATSQKSHRIANFAHGVVVPIPDPRGGEDVVYLIGSYHVSRQNTQTGRLTTQMFDHVLEQSARAAGL